jgi:folate-binding protein YgfZ
LPALGFGDATTLPAYATATGEIAGHAVTLCAGGPLDPADWILVTHGAAGEVEAVVAGLARRVSEDELKLMRIGAGLPAWGHELSDAVTPLEVNLLPAVSFDKGCYVGQEVIARQTNYDKITRRLVGLVFEPGAPADLEGARVEAPGRDGNVTSSAFAPRRGATIALAIVPRGLAEPGATVTVIHHEQSYPARVAPIPFS